MNSIRKIIYCVSVLFLCACADNLRSSYSPTPVPDRGDVRISTDGKDLTKISYVSVSTLNHFFCHKDRGNTIYIDARTWIKSGRFLYENTMSLFFPLVQPSEVATEAEWTGRSVQIYGRLGVPPFTSIAASLNGNCTAVLLRANGRLTGEIHCTNFRPLDDIGIPAYDLDITKLDCAIQN